jgi:hypothetical protein
VTAEGLNDYGKAARLRSELPVKKLLKNSVMGHYFFFPAAAASAAFFASAVEKGEMR